MNDVDTAIEIMKKAAQRLKAFPEHYAHYQEEMKLLWDSAPWKKTDIWTRIK